ncbi:MAG: DVUA0089 family protein [Saprospiraceae bacterium]|nr:DVUA0089 family protein [Saprospiraceae bacterium]
MKLSVQLICTFLIAVLFILPLEAKNKTLNTKPFDDCLPPGAAVIIDITSISARLTWTAPEGATGLTYEWEIGTPGFTPGEDGLLSGSVMDTTDLVVGLGAQTPFEVYVRSSCDGLIFSDWVGPVTFTTAPGCGDLFLDSGGLLSTYQNGEKTITTICPDLSIPPKVVSLAFTQFVLADGDTMQVFNGTSITDVMIGNYDQITTAPFTLTATNADGCLTVQFTSDLEKIEEGWSALVSCIEPQVCFPVDEINVFNLQATGANFSWPPVFGVLGYEWEIYDIQNMLVQTGTTTTASLGVTGLTEATNYTFRVRTLCPFGESASRTVAFYTPINCANKPVIHCGEIRTSSSIGQGIWQTNACSYATPGQEKLFRFVAPHTRMYTFQTVTGSSAQNAYVTYAYKESTEGCGPFDWNCIGSFNVAFNNTQTSFGPLTAGKEYLILFDAETTNAVTHSFRIRGCDAPNDEAPGAIALAVNSPCTGNIYSNTAATFNNVDSLGQEPNPDVEVNNVDEISGRWLTTADETVWFKFTAPPSGSVILSTESIPQGGNFDTQLALYETSDSSQYKLFKLIVSDDDNGNFGLGYNSVFSYSGLTPGNTYYIQVDGYGSIVDGNFCIEITEGVIRLNDAECTPGYFVENVDGTLPDGDHWYNVYSRPDELDLGDLLIAVKPGNQNLDTVSCQVSVADTIPFSANDVPYMPAYYNIRSSELPSDPYKVRLFFYQSEFDSLVAKSGLDPMIVSIDNLIVTHYSGPNEDCFQLNNSYEFPGPGTGIPTLITLIKAVEMPASKMFYLEFEMFTDGEVGVHLEQTVLPIALKSFTGKMVDGINRLEWTTEAEKNVAWHLIERSADGIKWVEMGRQPGQVDASFPTQYSFDDTRPLPKSYYRLRSIDFDGLSVLSNIVVLTREGAGLGIDRVFPSPTQDRLNIEYSTPEESDLTIRVSDLTGHVVLEEQITAIKGRHNTNLSLLSLPAGMYIVTLSDGVSVASPVRVVKK